MSIDWLCARVPGFGDLSNDERCVITDFTLLWSLFECRILNTKGNISSIRRAVVAWRDTGTLDASAFDRELAYFRNRYYANGEFTYHFSQLHLRDSDQKPLVRAVIDGSDKDASNSVAAALIIVFRYRNNLFHGVKWQYNLAGQHDNFSTANRILMKVLDQHGALGEG